MSPKSHKRQKTDRHRMKKFQSQSDEIAENGRLAAVHSGTSARNNKVSAVSPILKIRAEEKNALSARFLLALKPNCVPRL